MHAEHTRSKHSNRSGYLPSLVRSIRRTKEGAATRTTTTPYYPLECQNILTDMGFSEDKIWATVTQRGGRWVSSSHCFWRLCGKIIPIPFNCLPFHSEDVLTSLLSLVSDFTERLCETFVSTSPERYIVCLPRSSMHSVRSPCSLCAPAGTLMVVSLSFARFQGPVLVSISLPILSWVTPSTSQSGVPDLSSTTVVAIMAACTKATTIQIYKADEEGGVVSGM